MQFERPIPGQSLTTPPKSAPFERPPEIADPVKALDYHLDILDNPKAIEEAMFMLKMGIDLVSLVEGITRNAVFEGVHSVDVSLIISPVIHEHIKGYADSLGVDYEEGFEDKDEEERLTYGRRFLLAKKDLADEKQEGEGNMRDGERTYFEDFETDEIDPEMVTTPDDIQLRKTLREGQGDMASNKSKGLMARV
tara:strand:- start:2793 stop:3374 length:582 start_codon:yes stop_codon:yes gene_type:complete